MSAQEDHFRFEVDMCPRCGAHLGDTWDDDAEECVNCGFAYVHRDVEVVEAGGRRAPRGGAQRGIALCTFGWMVTLGAGVMLAPSMAAQTDAIASGGLEQWAATVDWAYFKSLLIGMVGMGLIIAGLHRGGRR